MKCSVAALVLGLVVSTAWAETPVCPVPGDWQSVPEFSDEFNGDKLDDAKWWDFNPMWVGRRPGLYVRDNVALKDGMLQITATKMPEHMETVENHKTALTVNFDSETFPKWSGMPTLEELPATFYIDYLRCWQLPDMKGATH